MAAGAFSDSDRPLMQEEADLFIERWADEKGQKVTIDFMFEPDWTVYHEQKLPTLVAAGTPPDVSWNSGEYVGPYVARGDWVMLLDGYIERDGQAMGWDTDFPPIVKQASIYKGNVVCIAEAGMVYQVTLYNEDFLAANGVPTPDDLYKEGKWTWDTFDEMARQLSQRDASDRPVQFGSATGPYTDYWGFMCRLWAYGADIYNDDETECILDSAEGYRLTEVVAKAVCQDKVAPRADDWDIDWLASGKLGINFGWPAFISSWQEMYKFSFDVAPVPAGPKGWIPAASFDGWQLAKATKFPEAAWGYTLFMNSPEMDLDRNLAWTRPPNRKSNFETWAQALLAQGRIKNVDYLRESMAKARLAHVVVPERPEFNRAYWQGFAEPISSCLVDGKDAVDKLSAETRKLIADRAKA